MNKKKEVLTRPLFFSLTKLFIELCDNCSINYNHLLILLNLRENTNKEIIEENLENIYLKFQEYILYNKEILNEVSKYLSLKKLKSLDKINYLINIFSSAYNLILLAQNYHSYSKSIEEKYKFIEYYKNRKKEAIDEIEEECTNNNFDIYDLSEFESIYTSLRHDKYSIEYLNQLPLQDILLLYYQLIDRNIIEISRNWFRDKLREIEQKVNEKIPLEHSDKGEMRDRTPEEKQILNDELEKEYFISNEDLKNNEKFNSIS